jgi:nuclear GTP-binding protein
MSSPPSTHASFIPSTIQSNGERIIAPGAENVGQAQILTELAKPFTLEGLFGAADAGAFGGLPSDGQDAIMHEDDGMQEETMNEDV